MFPGRAYSAAPPPAPPWTPNPPLSPSSRCTLPVKAIRSEGGAASDAGAEIPGLPAPPLTNAAAERSPVRRRSGLAPPRCSPAPSPHSLRRLTHLFHIVLQLAGHAAPIDFMCYDSKRHHILTADDASLRLWSLRKELRRAPLPRDGGTPSFVMWLGYAERPDVYIAVHGGDPSQEPPVHCNCSIVQVGVLCRHRGGTRTPLRPLLALLKPAHLTCLPSSTRPPAPGAASVAHGAHAVRRELHLPRAGRSVLPGTRPSPCPPPLPRARNPYCAAPATHAARRLLHPPSLGPSRPALSSSPLLGTGNCESLLLLLAPMDAPWPPAAPLRAGQWSTATHPIARALPPVSLHHGNALPQERVGF